MESLEDIKRNLCELIAETAKDLFGLRLTFAKLEEEVKAKGITDGKIEYIREKYNRLLDDLDRIHKKVGCPVALRR
jgi:cob(I)alamin adenosyltransferase